MSEEYQRQNITACYIEYDTVLLRRQHGYVYIQYKSKQNDNLEINLHESVFDRLIEMNKFLLDNKISTIKAIT